MKAALLAAAALALQPLQALAADPAKGQAVFDDRCSFCHQMEGAGQGPSLKGVVGRKAASLPGFSYSDALKSSNLTWTPENLGQFLVAPRDMVPGTAMVMTVPDATERADLIAYLAATK